MRTAELFWHGLRDEARERGWVRAVTALLRRVAGVLRESFPDRRRMRYGDIHYDFEHNVDTTWANVSFATRLREALVAADYQTTDPLVFREAMEMLAAKVDLSQFTFVDLGSGKGRVLLMAEDYAFRTIIGVELLPELHGGAVRNFAGHKCVELVCADVRDFGFPAEPLVLFLFNPFPEYVVRAVMRKLQRSLDASPRPVFVVYHNAQHEQEFSAAPALRRVGGTHQFAVYTNR